MRWGRGVLPRPRGRAEGRSWPVAATHSLRQRTCSSSHHSSATNDLRMMMVSLEFKIFEWFHLICMARATTRGLGTREGEASQDKVVAAAAHRCPTGSIVIGRGGQHRLPYSSSASQTQGCDVMGVPTLSPGQRTVNTVACDTVYDRSTDT
ncbi:hypothetical protein E2C01_050272 [Portunus trituberculatus]|uniref:Uncharacterized protein n=1 Tax=Portunus trituberculatus TaxID=210409 RepID=A0A5B7GFN7_PORTR|nr:hypothetical protein [Portunus trituberculatus]